MYSNTITITITITKMDIFKKINKMTNLSKTRIVQLDKKTEHCEEIVKHSNECPKKIIEYFINENSINRLQSIKVYEGDFVCYLNNVSDNLDTIADHTNRFDKVIQSKNFCLELDKFIKYQQEIIRV